MKPHQIVPFSLLTFLLLASMSFADSVDFEAEPLNSTYGAAYFHSPNDLIFVEDGVLVYITNYINNGNEYFTFGRIKESLPAPIDFHNGHIFQLNNVGAIFDFTGPGDATFEFAHFGGKINIEVNSGGVLVADHFSDLAGNLAPGLTLSVTGTSVPGGHKGTVTISGDVNRLRIGGQELYIDEVTGGGNLPIDDCTYAVTHETLNVGLSWGDSFGNSPGDAMFAEDGIKVFCEEFSYGGSNLVFGENQVILTPHPAFGFQRVMGFSKIANFYDVGALEINIASVSFEILTYGGVHNLQVNDGPLLVEEFTSMPGQVDSDIFMTVDSTPFPGGYRALVTLTGNVVSLIVGGETMYLDNLCVVEADGLSPVPVDLQRVQLQFNGTYPNPFNPSTIISFTTERKATVELSVLDMAGHRITTLFHDNMDAGMHEVMWDGRTNTGQKAPAGIYFVQLRSGQQAVSQKITMVK